MITFIIVNLIIQCIGILLGILRLVNPELNRKSSPGAIAFGIIVGIGFAIWAGLLLVGVIT